MICPGCLGCGWRHYFVETVEGEEERAWELCSECREGDAFPSKEGGQASAPSSPRLLDENEGFRSMWCNLSRRRELHRTVIARYPL
jgi:hypothetical protein